MPAILEFHERESARTARFAIDRQHDLRRRGDGAEVRAQVRFGCAYDRLPTNRRTANQLSPSWVHREYGAGSREGETATHTLGSRMHRPENLTRSRPSWQAGDSEVAGDIVRAADAGRRRATFSSPSWRSRPCRGTVSAAAGSGASLHRPADLKEWLTYIASDELEGRAVWRRPRAGSRPVTSEGHFRELGRQAGRRHGGYLQTVRVRGVKTTNHSTVTVQVGRDPAPSRTATGLTFPRNVGAKRTFTVDRRRVRRLRPRRAGARARGFSGKNVDGAAVVLARDRTDREGGRSADISRAAARRSADRYATDQLRAAADDRPERLGQAPARAPRLQAVAAARRASRPTSRPPSGSTCRSRRASPAERRVLRVSLQPRAASTTTS